ncbi:hypothetical protein VR46_41455 [Streptomyces sp. NRRL S-444]|nr:hypothetical protein VR46_41455 [Streptomyces sp. NRRL S-444]
MDVTPAEVHPYEGARPSLIHISEQPGSQPCSSPSTIAARSAVKRSSSSTVAEAARPQAWPSIRARTG